MFTNLAFLVVLTITWQGKEVELLRQNVNQLDTCLKMSGELNKAYVENGASMYSRCETIDTGRSK